MREEVTYVVVVQARMGSSRLPGKSFMKIGNRPMIDYLFKTLFCVFQKESIILATSIDPENDILREYAHKQKVCCVSGDDNNVASRFRSILCNREKIDYFFRVCGDSPLYDKEMLETAKELIRSEDPDFVTTMPNRGYPGGSNMEVFKRQLFLDHYPKFYNQNHFEHVTAYFYENREKFKGIYLSCEIAGFDHFKHKLSVDTQDEFDYISRMIEKMNHAPWKYSLEEKIRIFNKLKQQ